MSEVVEQRNKVFCIGLNKTGTTSVGDALKILGFNRFGWRPGISAQLVNRWHEGNFSPFTQVIEDHDAFEDLPWPLVFKELEERYPDAKFILTYRSNEEAWLSSIQKHIERGSRWLGHFLIYGSYDPQNDQDLYIQRYNRHNDDVRNYFASKPGKLIELCFENGDGWDKLCNFLGISEVPVVPFPHSNSAKLFEESEVQEKSKIFCIGLNKTGGTNIGDALEILGFKRFGWRPKVSSALVARWHEEKFEHFTRVIQEYDAFDNLPWPLVFKEIEERYPNAKFILTTRSEEDIWLRSIQKHIGRCSTWIGHFLIYGSYDPVNDKALYIKEYRRHNCDVREYFADRPGKLIEMCCDSGDGWTKLCQFLDIIKIPEEPFPNSSQTKSR